MSNIKNNFFQGCNVINRRDFLKQSGLIATAMLGAGIPFLGAMRKSLRYPFTLGVASGDPLPNSVVIWTRLVPEPLLGTKSMSNEPVKVHWEVSKDESFQHVVKQGWTVAKHHYAHSVHVEIDGLKPGQEYYYRFKAENEVSPMGRTKTLPAYDAKLNQLDIVFASCNKYSDGFYNAYDHMAEEDIDIVFFLGDYIYQDDSQGDDQGNIGRGHLPQKECRTLNDYRIRYGQYKSDPSLQAAHAAFPWIVALDDHEIENDWAGKTGNPEDKKAEFLARRSAAFQAYYEHMPVRKKSMPQGINMQLYSQFKYGDLAEFNVLDTRQYRSNYACNTNDPVNPTKCTELYDPSRTMLGEKQEAWLFNNLENSEAAWNILPQQVLMTQLDHKPGAGEILDTDKWDGYIATRNRLFDTIKNNNLTNTVVLTGDFHRNMATNLLEDFDDVNSRILATEFICTSIATNGDGQDQTINGKLAMKENTNVKFFNAQRGYVHCKITKQEIRTDFRVVPYVSSPGAPIQTRASFVVKNDQPGVNQI